MVREATELNGRLKFALQFGGTAQELLQAQFQRLGQFRQVGVRVNAGRGAWCSQRCSLTPPISV